MKYINELYILLKKENIKMLPCDNNEIKILENMTNQNKLPVAYLEFIKMMGNGTYNNQFMPGESCFMDEIKFLYGWAVNILNENESILKLTNDDFVFWMCQGCMFCFFKLSEGDNPPVYLYNENGVEDKFVKISYTFTAFLLNRLNDTEHLFKSVE